MLGGCATKPSDFIPTTNLPARFIYLAAHDTNFDFGLSNRDRTLTPRRAASYRNNTEIRTSRILGRGRPGCL